MLEKLFRHLLTALLRAAFRVEVRGLEHFEAVRGQRAVIVANHQSFLDPLLLAVFLPEKPAFAMNVFQARKWYFKPLLKCADVFTVDPLQPMSTKTIIQRLRGGQKVVVFPEGRITTSGGIMKVYEGTGLIIDRTEAQVLPVRIEGAQFSRLSRLQGKMRLRWFPRIVLTILPPVSMNLPLEARGKQRRALAAQRMSDILVESAFASAPWRDTLPRAILAAARLHGWRHICATDVTQAKLSYRALWRRSFALAGALRKGLGEERYVAVLLPTSLAGMVTFMALQLLGRVPAMLNFSAGTRNLLLACETARAGAVITSRAFVERGGLQAAVEALGADRPIIYLEDLRAGLTRADKLRAALAALAPARHLPAQTPDAPAVLLFTSGSEGVPKGVALSHANLLANIHQAAARIAFTQADVMLNALPIFHSFGLSAGTLLPLVLGIRTYLYPNPLHYRIIPDVCYDIGATILLGTDTFYNGYAKYAHAYDFHTVRIAVAGAEKLKPATRQLYMERFGLRILEGYGVTETSPVLAVNTPTEHKPGTVGRLLPGMGLRLAAVEGLARGARLEVRGPNVMLGYVLHARPGELQPQGAWYDTGDIVEVDADGYIAIIGRAKRFAKVGGEMVSLSAVEECAGALWPAHAHAALAADDARKGEQIVLLTENPEATREAFMAHARALHLPEISFPRRVQPVAQLPRLGSGKLDYPAMKGLVE